MPNIPITLGIVALTSTIVGVVCYEQGRSNANAFVAKHFASQLDIESVFYLSARDFLKGRM